jgi:hypothetical protein
VESILDRTTRCLRAQLNKCFMNEIEGRILIINAIKFGAFPKNVTLIHSIATLRCLLIFSFDIESY